MGIARPTSVFSNSDRTSVELQDVVNELAEDIGNAHEWSRLKVQQTYTGNGETDAYPLPPSYGRMPADQKVYTSRLQAPIRHVQSSDEWMAINVRDFNAINGAWTIIGGNVVFNPVLESAETAQLYFLSNQVAEDEDGNGQETFVADTDVFRLPERLLRLGLPVYWRRNKGLPFDPGPWANAMTEEIRRDGGSKSIAIGGATWPRDVAIAYPYTLG
jgi:hypothetical protein